MQRMNSHLPPIFRDILNGAASTQALIATAEQRYLDGQRAPRDDTYGNGTPCSLCGGTDSGQSHRGYVGRCACKGGPL